VGDPHILLATAFAALDDDRVAWCLLRGADLHAPDGDVDLLVAPADAPRLDALLARAGFARLPAPVRGSHTFHLAYDGAGGRWVKLDIVTELAFGGDFALVSDAGAACLARRRRAGAVAVLDDADAFWCLLLHRLLDKGAVGAAAADLARLAAAADCAGSPLAVELAGIGAPRCAPETLLALARRGAWAELDARAPALAAGWARRRRASVLRRRARARLTSRAGPLVRRRRGMTVALLGPDGAGKSTAATALEQSFVLPVHTLYMGSGRRWAGTAPPPGIGLGLRIAGQLGRWARGMSHRARGRLVVFDRYASDARLPAPRPLGRAGRARRWLLARSCPAPDMTVVLDAPGETLHARSGEHTAVLLEAQRQGYLAIARDARGSVVVDASRSADQAHRDLTAAIWAAYRQRWEPRRART